ncbi:GMC oxidoreductase [Rhizobium sp. BK313]|uniref:GMC oxidoreductase n=1 Tax=Rhizobium sp. BK313 TaxID=2587081 RepID=UPI003917F841
MHLRSVAHNFQGIGHPAGTLRVGDVSRTAIVDRNLRAYAFPNLFLLSTAVFPTIGHAQGTSCVFLPEAIEEFRQPAMVFKASAISLSSI